MAKTKDDALAEIAEEEFERWNNNKNDSTPCPICGKRMRETFYLSGSHMGFIKDCNCDVRAYFYEKRGLKKP